MIYLHQYPPIWNLSSLSPFCIKVELFLKIHNLPYQVVVEKNPMRGPKGKMPFIRDGKETIADSSFILEHLEYKYNLKTLAAVPYQTCALKYMIEEAFYFVLLYNRWIDDDAYPQFKREIVKLFPPVVGELALPYLRSSLRRQAQQQGLGRHSKQEVYHIGGQHLKALSEALADHSFFHGEEVSNLDCTAFSFLVTLASQPMRTKLRDELEKYSNLLCYVERMQKCFFA